VAKGIEISFLSDIPAEGSGLGSSSSVTVGVLNALYHYVGAIPTPERLAREACDIEIRILGKPIGVQDQYIAAYGGLRCFEFGPGPAVTVASVETTRTALEDLDNMLMLFYTGKTRQASTILSQQKSNIGARIEILKQMTRQAHQVRHLVESADIDGLGAILHQGWEAKRKLAQGVSSDELDEIYERAVKAGAIGGKISGAGGGGFFLLCVPSDKRQSVRQALANLREMPFRLERGGSRIVLNLQRY
jgi:D-glycero-alpha-D-manno-heptose-7-phosphate kinase